jgi:glycosyltransferase involved in cell wall biosynthesis
MPELAELEAQGHQLKIVPLFPQGKTVHTNAERFLAVSSIAPLCSSKIAREFIKSIGQEPGAVWRLVHLFRHGSVAMIAKNFALLPKAAWLARLAIDWRADHIHAFWASGPASLALAASELSGIPWSFSGHRLDIIENRLMRQKAKLACFVRFISADGLRLSGLHGTSLESKTTVLHLGIDVGVAPAATSTANVPVVLCVAALIPRKGHSILLMAIQELKRRGVAVELWLAGDGELREKLQEDVRARGLNEQVRFLGNLSHSALMSLYADGLVTTVALASYHEGIPVCLIEAMSFAVPVVATRVGGIEELLGNGAGVIVAPNDWLGISDALHQLITNVELRESLGITARKRVLSSFAAPEIATRMTALLTGSLQPQKVRSA